MPDFNKRYSCGCNGFHVIPRQRFALTDRLEGAYKLFKQSHGFFSIDPVCDGFLAKDLDGIE